MVIQDRLRMAQSRHQSYGDHKCQPLRFAVGGKVFLRVSPMKGVMRFGRRGKLCPWYIRLFEILRTVGEVAYDLVVPPALSSIHPVFHDSMMHRSIGVTIQLRRLPKRPSRRCRSSSSAYLSCQVRALVASVDSSLEQFDPKIELLTAIGVIPQASILVIDMLALQDHPVLPAPEVQQATPAITPSPAVL
ncbi:uncharacterized protein LOC129872433 [Solanum dulcamara]|uniref:uncharacterized protein LOC129872433 n=1 Tax=Solanum dulcamara TaxID=45834 RepID=UPI002486CA48|nr:uncharacterized protein LOC129872433 [Solanum dulcamara]